MLVRDRTSNDMWRVLNQLDDRLATPATSLVMLAGDAAGVLNQTLLGLAAFHGLARENMTRAQAWRFLDMGLRIERAVYLCTLLDATLHSPDAENPSVLEAVLEVADSSITFRSRYNLLPHVPAVFDLVLLDDKNPRSVLFQIAQLGQHFEHLPRERETARRFRQKHFARMPVQRLTASSTRANWPPRREALATPKRRSSRGNPRQRCATCRKLSDAIAASYFAHSAISRTGQGEFCNDLPNPPSHALRIRRAGDGVASCRAPRTAPHGRRRNANSFTLKIFPEPTLRKSRPDYFGNRLCFFSIQEVHSRLEIITHSRVSVTPRANRRRSEPSTPWERSRRHVPRPGFAGSRRAVSIYFRFAASLRLTGIRRLRPRKFCAKALRCSTGVRDLTRRIFEDFKYDPKATTVATPLEEVWEKRRGVCQDFAHLGIACLRSLGLPARYVSGYLRTRPPEGQPRLVGADASHAWFAIFCPGIGWVDFDPTNNVQPAEEHITVAVGRDYARCQPRRGSHHRRRRARSKSFRRRHRSYPHHAHEVGHHAPHSLPVCVARFRQRQRTASRAHFQRGADPRIL